MDGAMLEGGSQVRAEPVDAGVDADLKRRAALRVASSALDAEDCALLLDALGLTAQDGLAG